MTDKPVEQKQEQKVETKELPKNRVKLRQTRRDDSRRPKADKDQFEVKLVEIRRVTKMNKGGRRMKLSVFVAIGDKKGRVGLGLGKGEDVRSAQDKAVSNAKKRLIQINLKGNTIPHEIMYKFKSAKVLLKPASAGTGIVAGSSMRLIAEVAGINDLLGKLIGSNNKITNAYATVKALSLLRSSRL